uniref:GDSL esterase/lipase At5g45950-like isoform X1 n=1 Tax=Erigeron canadensis TaxID=72917 RepID=UPI001CB900E1|nr:GDSL esterase/lipase At5g45950-like isoform X1 [Erigeron canadensis]
MMKFVIALSLVALLVVVHNAQALDVAKLRLFAAKNNVSCIFVFGDSSVDPGNNNNLITDQKGNFLPYGKDFYNGRPTGRFTNGRLATDLIADALGHTKTIPAYLDPNLTNAQLVNGVSFASGGSGFDDLTAQLSNVIPLSKQLEYFREYKARLAKLVGKKRAENLITNGVFLLSMGTNDFLQNYYVEPTRSKQFTIDKYQHFLISSMSKYIQGMHAEGARRLAVVGMEPFGCTPLIRALKGTTECDDSFNKVALNFNQKIISLMATLEPSLGIRNFYTDIYGLVWDTVHNPKKYGFVESSKGCCGSGLEFGMSCKGLPTCANRSQYVYWDAVHFTEEMYKIISEAAIQTLMKTFG